MKKTIGFICAMFCLAGCAQLNKFIVNKPPVIKEYPISSRISKEQLLKDLKSGKVAIDTTLDYVRSSYGNADDMLVVSRVVRLIYRIEPGKNVTLWFEDGSRLSMWSY